MTSIEFRRGWSPQEYDDLLDMVDRRGGSTARHLSALPTLEPLSRQREVAHECIRRARRAGLRVPTFQLYWRDRHRGADIVHGAATLDDGLISMHLDAFLVPGGELERVVYHELMHVAEFASGRYRELKRGEREERADRFSYQMLSGETIDADLLPPSSTSTTRAIPSPASLRPRVCPRALAVDSVARELRHRIGRLGHGGDDGRALRVVGRLVDELARLAWLESAR